MINLEQWNDDELVPLLKYNLHHYNDADIQSIADQLLDRLDKVIKSLDSMEFCAGTAEEKIYKLEIELRGLKQENRTSGERVYILEDYVYSTYDKACAYYLNKLDSELTSNDKAICEKSDCIKIEIVDYTQ